MKWINDDNLDEILISPQSVCLRSSVYFSFLNIVTSVLRLRAAACLPWNLAFSSSSTSSTFLSFAGFLLRSSTSSEILLEEVCCHFIESLLTVLELLSYRRLSSSFETCAVFFKLVWPRETFFANGIHLDVSNLLVSATSVCLLPSILLSVYFFKQSTSALRLLWLRGDRDGLRWPLPVGPALS